MITNRNPDLGFTVVDQFMGLEPVPKQI